MADIFDLGDDWTDSGTVYDAIKINVADTASAAGSKLIDLQVGGVSQFKVDKDGNVVAAGTYSGLDQVDNTSDADKPVSTLQAAAIGVVQSDVDAHEALTNNPHAVTATQVGLGSVDNTSDADKPVSTLQATAIGVVQSDVDNHEALTNNPHAVTATQVGLGSVDNTSDLDKPVSTLQQAAIDASGGGAFGADANTLITASTPIVLDQATGDEAALTLDYTTNKATSGNDTGLLINHTDTLSPGTSKLLDLQVGGASKFSVDSDGNVVPTGNILKPTQGTGYLDVTFGTSDYNSGITCWANTKVSVVSNDVGVATFSSSTGLGVMLKNDLPLSWGTAFVNGASNLFLYRDAANTLAQRNGVNAQTHRIYNTYTSATDFERGFLKWDADTFVIGTEAGSGGGTVRDIHVIPGGTASTFIHSPDSAGGDAAALTLRRGASGWNDGKKLPIDWTKSSGTQVAQIIVTQEGSNNYSMSFNTRDSVGGVAERVKITPTGGLECTEGLGLHGATPPAQAAHITDATDATDVITRVNAILVALENIGITAAA